MKKKKKLIIVSIVVVLVIGAIVALNMSNKKNAATISVKTASVSKGDIKSSLSTTGVVKSKYTKEYFGPPQAKIKTVSVKVGDTVKKGQLLFTFEIPDKRAGVRQAELQYNNAVSAKNELISQRNEASNRLASIDKEIAQLSKSNNPADQAKVEALKQQKSAGQPISNEKIQQANNAVSVAKESLDIAKEQAAQNKDTVEAEADGVVTALTAAEGSMSTGAQPLATVQNIQDLKLIVSLSKYDIDKVKVGQEAKIKVRDKELKGKVSSIDPVAKKGANPTNPDSTISCEVEVLEKTTDLKIDLDGDVEILLEETKGVLKVPSEAIRSGKDGKNFVYIVENGKVKESAVKLGTQSDTETQIVEGVKEKDKIVLNPNDSIKNGVMVKEMTGDVKK